MTKVVHLTHQDLMERWNRTIRMERHETTKRFNRGRYSVL